MRSCLIRLAEFLRQASTQLFCYGKTDCANMVDGCVRQETGISPLETVAYKYVNDYEGRVIISEHGGLARATSKAMRRSGFKRTKSPQVGDVGVIEMFGRECVAIFDGEFWIGRDHTGIPTDPRARVIAAWRISERKIL